MMVLLIIGTIIGAAAYLVAGYYVMEKFVGPTFERVFPPTRAELNRSEEPFTTAGKGFLLVVMGLGILTWIAWAALCATGWAIWGIFWVLGKVAGGIVDYMDR